MTRDASLTRRLQSGAADFLAQFREYLGIGGKVRRVPIRDREALASFLSTRASFIAQTSLYGYLRTRAGMRYPALFDEDPFVVAINIAKWHLWLACLSDLTVYAGGLLAHRGQLSQGQAQALMQDVLEQILAETGVPGDADAEFPAHAQRVRARIALTHWQGVKDDEDCFHESPAALVRWAPVIEHLKQLDEEIVRNSVRFHWQEVRRELRRLLDARSVVGAGND
jgi:hypothetical protein